MFAKFNTVRRIHSKISEVRLVLSVISLLCRLDLTGSIGFTTEKTVFLELQTCG